MSTSLQQQTLLSQPPTNIDRSSVQSLYLDLSLSGTDTALSRRRALRTPVLSPIACRCRNPNVNANRNAVSHEPCPWYIPIALSACVLDRLGPDGQHSLVCCASDLPGRVQVSAAEVYRSYPYCGLCRRATSAALSGSNLARRMYCSMYPSLALTRHPFSRPRAPYYCTSAHVSLFPNQHSRGYSRHRK